MTTATEPAKISHQAPKALRTAKGKKPEYFSDPAVDKLLSIVISLAGELSTTRERLDALERVLQGKGLLDGEEMDRYRPSEAAEKVRAENRSRFVARILRTVEAELREITGDDMPENREQILKILKEC